MKKVISIFWFRRDLRLDDNHGLFQSLQSGTPVLPIFIFDPGILDQLPSDDHRVTYIHQQVSQLNRELQKNDSGCAVYYGNPIDVFRRLLAEYDVQNVYVNRDYEPAAITRDTEIADLLKNQGVPFNTYKDQVIFEQDEVVKDDGNPYVVYTPYMKRWRARFNPATDLPDYDVVDYSNNFIADNQLPFLTLSDIGFTESKIAAPTCSTDLDVLANYGNTRDFPAESGTSMVGLALRFGTISIRRLVSQALLVEDDTYLKELIWREFFMQILWHFPYTVNHAFREQYDTVPWRNNIDEFEKWKTGQTGYPMVDAGMRELNATGYMHNRVRMVVASFLCKHLLIDWRWGERYFAEKLFDFELSSNVGNWQWAAGSGVDAAPYFRVFNPETQMKKFDPNNEYVRRWVPEYFGIGYVQPMVEHKFARERAIETYKTALSNFEK